jgi:hypothetical protein
MISETRERLLAVERELNAIYDHVRRASHGEEAYALIQHLWVWTKANGASIPTWIDP